jgi:predicted Zn-dependent peptidase
MNDDDPEDVAHEAFTAALHGDHPLGRPIGGTNQTITDVTRDAVWEHYKANYRPQDLVIAAAGGVNHDELVRLVEEALTTAGWDLSLVAAPRDRRFLGDTFIPRSKTLEVIKRPISQTNILIGCQGLVADDDARYDMAVLNTVLGGGMSSRLFQEVREKRGLAYSVYSFNQAYSDGAIFGLYAGCAAAKSTEVAGLLWDELEKLANEGISADELELARGNISGSLALKFESSMARMNRLFSTEIHNGKFYDLDETLLRYSQVEAENVQRVAQTLIGRERSLVAVGDVTEAAFKSFA